MLSTMKVSGVLAAVVVAMCSACSSGTTTGEDGTGLPETTGGDVSFGEVDVPEGEAEVFGQPCQTNQDCVGLLEGLGVCEIALCDSVQQVCIVGTVKDYSPCDDSNVCTSDTFCLSGQCGGGILEVCDDGNVCTDDSCDPAAGCMFAANQLPCDDGNPCTQGDVCSNGMCTATPGGCPCESDADCLVAGPVNLCKLEVAACVAGQCSVTVVDEVKCDVSLDTDCMKNTCAPDSGECVQTPVTGACSDGNTCTVGDQCLDGACKGGENMCGCQEDADCDDFEDGNLCNGTLKCMSGLCSVDPATVVTCPQVGVGPCEVNKCNPQSGVCQKQPMGNGTACSDNDTCTDMDKCQNGQCAGTLKKCDDGNPCTVDTCQPGAGCVSETSDGIPCSDGDECTTGDLCVDGVCTGGEFVCGNCGDQVCDGQETCESCPADCGDCPVSDCCAPHEGPGCADEAIQKCVCAQDAYCCETAWDDVCVGEVEGFGCGVCGSIEPVCGDTVCDPAETCESCPDDCGPCVAGACCEPHDAPGCDDPGISACVCAKDPFCCETAWDALCVSEVEDFGCGLCEAPVTCGDGVCDDTETCVTCEKDCGPCVAGPCCEVHAGTGCDDEAVTACVCAQDAYCCQVEWDSLCVDEVTSLQCGDCGVVVLCGNQKCEAGEDCKNCPQDCGECPVACGDGKCEADEMCNNCAQDCGECSGKSCCVAHDQKGCKDPAVTKCVCAMDPYCCTNNWDGLCASEADQCGSCNGDCCKEHNNPGCDDETVEACVCAQDPFCCETAWDGICVNEVTSLKCGVCQTVQCGNQKCEAGEDCKNCPQDCGVCPAACGDGKCDPGEHCENCPKDCGACSTKGCCVAHDQKGCKDPAVTKCVCSKDPFCCTNNWDGLCAAAADTCGSCNGDCCKIHNNPGCDDETVEACVCAQDPFCCETAWDGICVSEVTSLKCGACQTVQCGNQKCEAGEDCKNCPQDCGVCPAACGNGQCETGEHCENCPKDCGACSTKGCCVAHDQKGCKDPAVTKCVCSKDPFCCTTMWDGLCAAAADTCGSCNGDCCKTHNNPGCDDETIEACVCKTDSFCCETAWDGICVSEVDSLACGKCVAAPVCGDGKCNGVENCQTCPGDCGQCCGNGQCQANLGEDSCTCPKDCPDDPNSCSKCQCNGSGGNCYCDDACVAAGDCCANACQMCGKCDACGNGKCDPGENCATCPGDCGACSPNSCCVAHAGKGCKDPAVAKCVCDKDPFCCNNNWDGLCAAAADTCGSCNGSCCSIHGNPGCDDETIEACVCKTDGFCCSNSWDGLCVAEVTSLSCGICK
ncbi:MAG: hypothetical protein FJ109_06930 [Deltaproteobacteria bacterium]|nr:hypothetical protein [Deltaproteobacteria bacterium]